MIAFGFLTRLGAFFAAGEMMVAYFMVHAKAGFFPLVNHGELAVANCWFFLFVLFYGSGRWSLDALLFKKGSAGAG
jgi:putative oxidoreductase